MASNEDALEQAVWDWFSVQNVGRMLRGMGLECLLKAAWLRAGQVLFEDLYSMYNEVNRCRRIVLDTEEKELLARLSKDTRVFRSLLTKFLEAAMDSA
jgi:hypothetical protein